MVTLGAYRATRVTAVDGRRLWRTTLAGLVTLGGSCDWCSGGRVLYAYTWSRPAKQWGDQDAFCSLHCWGQKNGFVYL